MRKQLKVACKFCGLYAEPKKYIKGTHMSSTWKKLYTKYKNEKPKLTKY